jgi:hypothetical protein
MKIILSVILIAFTFFSKAQNVNKTIHSDRNVTTLSGGESINIEKVKDNYFWFVYGNTNKWVSIHDAPIGSGKATSSQSYRLYSIKSDGSCINYWTKDDSSNKIILFQLCEDDVEPYIKMSRYDSDASTITKKTYYYFD